MAAGWVIEKSAYGARMVMKGPWSPEALAAARFGTVRELELNHAKGWRGKDVSFLTDLADLLVSFTIIDFTIDNVEAVNSLSGLRFLDVNTYCKTELRFSQFPLLEECSLEWRAKARSLFEHTGIKRLFLNKYPGKDLKVFEEMNGLRSLSLASPKIETLDGITALNKLTFLGLYVARRLKTLDGLQELTDLVQLEVNDCPRINDIATLANLRRLEELHLCNDGDIETLKPIAGHRDLRVLLFYESTNILDGDLSVLKGLPKLEHVVFMDRPHYSHKPGDFPRRKIT